MDEETIIKKAQPAKRKFWVPIAVILIVIIVVMVVVTFGNRSADEQKQATPQIQSKSRFIAYNDGTVLDTKTKLMWVVRDNGSGISWKKAESYCVNYRGGGYTDWRMPTLDELKGLYESSKSRPAVCNTVYNIHVATELIDLTCYAPWASETRGSEAAYFSFNTGSWYWKPQSHASSTRALPVRSGK
ncbi:MAG: DUF1566 domain-containing protein [Deltaproteobacteria bacterium]|nr:DUF1566 domain-containing protein [Deltaproteobacteria bacterium]